MKPNAASISLAGSSLSDTRHVCAFFRSDDEEYRVLLPFMKDGFDCGHKAIHVVNPDQRADHLRRLAAAGIDTTATAERGQFELRSSVDNVIEFESRVNDVWCRHDDAVICTYRLAQFSGDTVIDIMRTHPMVIIGGILHRNPFFVSPEQFLPEFRARRAKRPGDVAV